jgi:hypothetical protein
MCSFLSQGVVWDWVQLVCWPLTGLLYQSWMIDECGESGKIKTGIENLSTWRTPASVRLCSLQIPHDPTWDWTQATALGSQQLVSEVSIIYSIKEVTYWRHCLYSFMIMHCSLPRALASFTACRISSAKVWDTPLLISVKSPEPSREEAWSPPDILRSRSASTCFSCSAKDAGGPARPLGGPIGYVGMGPLFRPLQGSGLGWCCDVTPIIAWWDWATPCGCVLGVCWWGW